MPTQHKPELVCPAGTPAALKTAVDSGADAVYCGFKNATNARNFPGLNFSFDELAECVKYAHDRKTKVLLATNTFPPAGKFELWKKAIDDAVDIGVDAIIVADIGVANYARRKHPNLRLHLSVQAGAPSIEAIKYYCEEFNVQRVVLPRILTIPEIKSLKKDIFCEIECFIFGNHGLMAEGRCSLTNYATGLSTNMDGVCSPAHHVSYEEDKDKTLTAKLNGFTIDCFSCTQNPGYPTICKGRYLVQHKDNPYYAFEEPVSLNLADLLPELIKAGVDAFKIEGRQRSKAYIQTVVSSWREAVDCALSGRDVKTDKLLSLTEGHKQTQGAYESKRWR
ncbi:ubiquinone anaerobic biosynthesis protein UbiU [Micavibrio aeruginosavorus]|uniref:Collagenase-related protease n=1 Tax=Micavibrio aeruginosavorus EPB TaxID=349215 RepID=M4VEL6_9BACT|nr:peptidase U32 family protein [Micavibrio aeruginosavorus]AGH97673.1 Collagenase-related protease [Micavibrio aeruginosavorus EPB]